MAFSDVISKPDLQNWLTQLLMEFAMEESETLALVNALVDLGPRLLEAQLKVDIANLLNGAGELAEVSANRKTAVANAIWNRIHPEATAAPSQALWV
eukprot:6115496-Amphidinium_carterae.1